MTPKIGDSASISKEIVEADLHAFAALSLDANPVHLDAAYASSTMFGGQIAHGMYVASLISAVLGNDLPGPGTIYMGQELRFMKPAYVGDTVTATVSITEQPKPNRYRLSTTCTNQSGETLIEGSALVMYASPS